MKKNEIKSPLFLGDPEFNRKISVYYAWCPSIALFLLFILFEIDHAFLTGIILLFLALFLLPPNKFRMRISKIYRAIIIFGFIFLVFYSMNLYL